MPSEEELELLGRQSMLLEKATTEQIIIRVDSPVGNPETLIRRDEDLC